MTEMPPDAGAALDPLGVLRALVEQQRHTSTTPVREWNRLSDAIRAEWLRLAGATDTRDPLLRAAFSDADRDVRLNAALAVETWDPVSATQAFEQLVTEVGGVVVRPMTMTAALAVPSDGRDAALCLLNADRAGGTA